MKRLCSLAIVSLVLAGGCCGDSNTEVSAYSEPTTEMKTQMQNYEAQAKVRMPNAER